MLHQHLTGNETVFLSPYQLSGTRSHANSEPLVSLGSMVIGGHGMCHEWVAY
jgi:hypothetical protein